MRWRPGTCLSLALTPALRSTRVVLKALAKRLAERNPRVAELSVTVRVARAAGASARALTEHIPPPRQLADTLIKNCPTPVHVLFAQSSVLSNVARVAAGRRGGAGEEGASARKEALGAVQRWASAFSGRPGDEGAEHLQAFVTTYNKLRAEVRGRGSAAGVRARQAWERGRRGSAAGVGARFSRVCGAGR